MPQISRVHTKDFSMDLFTDEVKRSIKSEAECALRRHFQLPCGKDLSDELNGIETGVFVTLKEEGDLRGCIGFINSETGLADTIRKAAILAATQDPRFVPVTSDEMEKLEVQVTVLGRPVPLIGTTESDISVITIGRHGLIVESRFGRGLLLPQVATEWNFSREEFIEAACIKAGLDRDSWRNNSVRLYYFDALNIW